MTYLEQHTSGTHPIRICALLGNIAHDPLVNAVKKPDHVSMRRRRSPRAVIQQEL